MSNYKNLYQDQQFDTCSEVEYNENEDQEKSLLKWSLEGIITEDTYNYLLVNNYKSNDYFNYNTVILLESDTREEERECAIQQAKEEKEGFGYKEVAKKLKSIDKEKLLAQLLY